MLVTKRFYQRTIHYIGKRRKKKEERKKKKGKKEKKKARSTEGARKHWSEAKERAARPPLKEVRAEGGHSPCVVLLLFFITLKYTIVYILYNTYLY